MTIDNASQMSESEYRELPAVNYSNLKHMRKSPLHYLHAVNNPEQKSPNEYAMLRAIHALVLEPFDADSQIVVWEGRRDVRNKEYAAFLEANKGKNILTPSENEEARSIAGAYNRNIWVQRLLAMPETKTETPVVWDFDLGELGILKCKGKPDIMHYSERHGLIIADLKTFGETSAALIAWAARKHGWLIQLSHYTYAAAHHYNIDLATTRVRWMSIVAEDKAPWDATCVEWDARTQSWASAEHLSLLEQVARCSASGHWPGAGELQSGSAFLGAPAAADEGTDAGGE